MDQVAETDNNMMDIQSMMLFATRLDRESYPQHEMAGHEMAISLIREGVGQLPVRHPDRLFASDDLAGALLSQFTQSGQHEDVNESISLYRETLELRSEFHPDRSRSLAGLANALFARFDVFKQSEDLDEAISLLRHLIGLGPGLYLDRYHSLTTLADTLFARFEHSSQREDLEEAISLHRKALELRSPLHPDLPDSLDSLIKALVAQFDNFKRYEDLDEVISLLRDEIELRPVPHPDRYSSLCSLGATLTTRFEKSGQREDIDEAILLHRQALELLSPHHPNWSSCLHSLIKVVTRLAQFDDLKQSEDLGEAILLLRDELELRPVPHPDRYSSLSSLGVAITTQFELSGQRENIDEAISLHRKALKLLSPLHPDWSSSLDNLAKALIARFDHLEQYEDLNEAIALRREILELRPVLHPDRSWSLSNLASILKRQFKESGRCEDGDEAVSLYREALELLPATSVAQCSALYGLGDVLEMQFKQQSDRYEIMEEAILLLRRALELLSANHSHRSIYLFKLAGALYIRFGPLRQLEDLEEAISLYRNPLELLPASHPKRSTYLVDFAVMLSARFDMSAQPEDMEEAVSLCREALKLLPTPHPLRGQCLNILASVLIKRGKEFSQCNDFDESISLLQDALDLEPQHHVDQHLHLLNLASAFCSRFSQSNQATDLDMAINSCYVSLNTLASEDPHICSVQAGLGEILMTAYSKTQKLEYLDKSIEAFQDAVACESAPTSLRFHIARLWALYADDSHHASALNAYCAAIEFLPWMAMFGLHLQARQQALSNSNGLACDVAACAIRLGQYEQAVELLEAGRAVFWSQALRLRTPMTGLSEIAPELAEKLTRTSSELEWGSLSDMSRNVAFTTQQIMTISQKASHSHHLNNEWLATLAKVRELDGFQDFLRPSQLPLLQNAAADGSVVILIASNKDCNALILTSTGVRHVPLQLTLDMVNQLIKFVHDTIKQDGRDNLVPESNHTNVDLVQQMLASSDIIQFSGLPLERHMARISDKCTEPGDLSLRDALGILFVCVALPIIKELNLKKSDNLPRLHWCPTGPFAFLPIHAAGIFFEGKEEECISEYVVSSYTPTIGALLSRSTISTNSFKMLAVIQPDTPGQRPLPYTIHEMHQIEAHVPSKDLVKLVCGSVEEVLSHLPDVTIVHFACHGQQNTQNPFDSALLLQNGQLKVSQIMQQSMPNASLAFLSACETAMGHENLPDEAIHLSAGLLFAGFSGVVATMWSISDSDGPKIAETFYENIFKENNSALTNDSGPDTTQPARALHLAVAKLRAENVSLIRWVPFIHLGR